MALISAFTLIRIISLFHITLAFFFLTAPKIVSDQNVVYILGEAIRVPHATSLDKPSDASSFIAVILAFLGIADLTAASLNEQISLQYWLSNVPVRLVYLFGLTGYIFLFKDDGLLGSDKSMSMWKPASPGELVRNSLVFSWAFFETAMWFWIFSSLREERRDQARKLMEKQKAQEDRL